MGTAVCDWLDNSPGFDVLGASAVQRIECYRDYVNMADDARKETEFISAAVERNQLTGGADLLIRWSLEQASEWNFGDEEDQVLRKNKSVHFFAIYRYL